MKRVHSFHESNDDPTLDLSILGLFFSLNMNILSVNMDGIWWKRLTYYREASKRNSERKEKRWR